MSRSHQQNGGVRSSGILLHVTSLPGRYGVGDLGPAAVAWVDALARAKQSWWQVLPMSPPGDGDSPYQSYSAFAGNPDLISPDKLVEDGLLDRSDLHVREFRAGLVAYPIVRPFKCELLDNAWARFGRGAARHLHGAFEKFIRSNSHWLDDYALFMALKEASRGLPWTRWPRELADRTSSGLRRSRDRLHAEINRHQFIQFMFFRQLGALRKHAASKGVKIIGDLPMFVSADSADVWANREQFRLDARGRPVVVAGVPPDFFSRSGQRWGNPLYDWRRMQRDGFRWWIARIRSALTQADLLRIDHFRGLEACWEIPAAHTSARRGRWIPSPGAALLRALKEELGGLPFIAEDLGVITPEVERLRDDFGLPGMRVLQFAFGTDAANPFLPHNYSRNTVAYTGTHDNDTTAGWYRSLSRDEKSRVQQYAPGAAHEPSWEMIHLAWSSVADMAIAPVQDILGLGSEARMNVPGTASGNWQWRLPHPVPPAALDRLQHLTELYRRGQIA